MVNLWLSSFDKRDLKLITRTGVGRTTYMHICILPVLLLQRKHGKFVTTIQKYSFRKYEQPNDNNYSNNNRNLVNFFLLFRERFRRDD